MCIPIRYPNHSPRHGMSVIEVLFAMGVAVIGLLGIALADSIGRARMQRTACICPKRRHIPMIGTASLLREA